MSDLVSEAAEKAMKAAMDKTHKDVSDACWDYVIGKAKRHGQRNFEKAVLIKRRNELLYNSESPEAMAQAYWLDLEIEQTPDSDEALNKWLVLTFARIQEKVSDFGDDELARYIEENHALPYEAYRADGLMNRTRKEILQTRATATRKADIQYIWDELLVRASYRPDDPEWYDCQPVRWLLLNEIDEAECGALRYFLHLHQTGKSYNRGTLEAWKAERGIKPGDRMCPTTEAVVKVWKILFPEG